MKKTKLDWNAHKQNENLSEELKNIRDSKTSKVERDAFLMRTDHRTFEIERDERLKERSNLRF